MLSPPQRHARERTEAAMMKREPNRLKIACSLSRTCTYLTTTIIISTYIASFMKTDDLVCTRSILTNMVEHDTGPLHTLQLQCIWARVWVVYEANQSSFKRTGQRNICCRWTCTKWKQVRDGRRNKEHMQSLWPSVAWDHGWKRSCLLMPAMNFVSIDACNQFTRNYEGYACDISHHEISCP